VKFEVRPADVEAFMAHTRKWKTAETQRDEALVEIARLRDELGALAATVNAMRHVNGGAA
jgi:hypothetical protein